MGLFSRYGVWVQAGGLVMLSMVVFSTGGTARADGGKLYQITVERAAVVPTKPDGRNWDTTIGGSPDAAKEAEAALIKTAAKALITKALGVGSATPAGLVLSIGVMTAKYALGQIGNAVAYPDVTGQLFVDGRLVVSLDIAKDTYTPSWSNESAPLELKGNERIRLLLVDKETGLKVDDQIGECNLTLDAAVKAGPLLLSDCSGSALGAAISLRESAAAVGPALIEAGAYQVYSVEIGVASRKPTANKTWDAFGGEPDPLISIEAEGKRYECDVVRDKFKATCNPRNLFVRIGAKSTISVIVTDVDKLSSDVIGTASLGRIVGRKPHKLIPMQSTGGLQYASVQLGPTDSRNLPPLPAKLSRSEITVGMGRIRGRVTSCGDQHGGGGTVKVEIKIAGDGSVASADGSGGTVPLRDCVVKATKQATFVQTQLGAAIIYPFVFR